MIAGLEMLAPGLDHGGEALKKLEETRDTWDQSDEGGG